MLVRNVHERHFTARAEDVGALIDGLASRADRLWPSSRWPGMRLDRPLAIGAVGGHGPIHYQVEAYEPGKCVRFRLHTPRGFDGFHAFEVLAGNDGTTLRHIIEMNARGPALFTWPVIFAPLHDALVEDLLDTAACALKEQPRARRWSLRVRLLRGAFGLLSHRRSRSHLDKRSP